MKTIFSCFRSSAYIAGIASFLFFSTTNVYALPQDGVVAGGNVTISTPNAGSMQINQSSQQGIVNWQSYNVGQTEHVHYQQPNASSITLNRVNPNNGPAQIYGSITANGQVWLVNPAGVWFGPSAHVDVGGLIASTADIRNEDFMAGRYHFTQSPDWHGAVINEGYIKTSQAGIVALVGSGVVNNGYIESEMGSVVLASGSEFTVKFSGNELVSFTVDKETIQPALDQNGQPLRDSIRNSGKIVANGGKVLMTAKTASQVLDNAINMSGVVEAKSVGVKNGEIILAAPGEKIVVSGKLIASGKRAGEKGGKIHVIAKHIAVVDAAQLDVSGDQGGGEILIGGDAHGANPAIPNASSVYVGPHVIASADAITFGDGGKVVVWADEDTHFYGSIFARGGATGGNGGWVETSGKMYLDVANAHINTLAPQGVTGTWLLDPTNIYIAFNQVNATAAGMTGTDNSASINNNGTFQATGVVQDSLLDTTSLTAGLLTNNIIVTTANASGTGVGNITVVDGINWSNSNTLTLIADNNIAINAVITTGTAGSALILSAGNVITQSATIGGSGGLTLNGGTFTLSQPGNSYTGTTTINAGTLTVSTANVIPDSSAVTLADAASAILQLGNFNETIGSLSGGGSTGGNIILSAGTLTVNQAADLTYAGVMSTSLGGGLTKAGSSTLTLSGANTYNGPTTINAGTLKLGAAGVIADNSPVVLANVASAVFDLNNFNETIGGLSGGGSTGGNVSLGSGTLTVNAIQTLTYLGAISGTGGLTMAGPAVLILSGANTYTGATTMSGGSLVIDADSRLGTAPSVATPGNIVFAGGNLETTSSFTLNTNRGISFPSNTSTLIVDPSTTLSYGGIITNSGTFHLDGSGILLLSGNNTFTGTFDISNATLRIGASGGVIADTATINLSNSSSAIFDLNNNSEAIGNLTGGGNGSPITLGSGTLTVNQTTDSTFAGIISGSGGLTKAGSAILTLSGVNTYTGATTINAGTLKLGAAGVIADNSAVTLADVASAIFNLNNFNETVGTLSGGGSTGGNISLGSATLTVNQGADLTYAGIISGTGKLTKAGSNTLTLSGANAYTGTTTINAGTLQLGAAGVIADNSAVTLANVASAIFDLNNFNETVGTLSGGGITGGNISLGSGTLTVNQASAVTYAGIISGTGGLTKAGSSTLTLSGANTYSGTTTINAGTLRLGAAGVIADNSAVTLANVASAIFNLNNFSEAIGTLSGGGITGGNISLGSGTLTVNQTADLTYAGVISGTGGLTKAGSNMLTLSGANTYSGTTTINAGTLQLGAAGVIADNSAITLANVASAIFNLNNFSEAIGTLSGGGITGGNINLGSGTLTVNQAADLTYAGVISGTGGLTKAGSNMLTISGINTYSGTTTINAGTLQLGAAGVIADNSAITLADVAAAIFNLNNFSEAVGTLSGGGATGGNISLGSGTLTVNQASDLTYAGIISGTGGLTKAGSNMLTLSGINTYSGTTTINAGTLQLGAAGVIADNSAITLANVASAIFNLNNFSEAVGTLSGGGITGGNINLGSGTLTVNQAADLTYAGVISGTGGLTKAGSNMLTISGINTYSGTTTINSGTLQLGAAGVIADNSAVTLANVASAIFDLNNFNETVGTLSGGGVTGGNISLGSGTLTVNQASNLTYAGVISGTGGLTKAGSNTLTLSGANAYTGTTTINAGTLRLGAAGVIADNSAVTLADAASAILDLNNFSETISSLSGGGSTGGNITISAAILTVNQAADLTYAGVMSSSLGGGLTKAGSSTLTLSGANTYNGPTTINAGTLKLGAAGVIADNSPVVLANVASAVFDLNNFNETIGGLSGGGITGGNVSLGSGTLTVNPAGGLTYAGAISGTGGFTMAGPAVFTLSGTNTYTGVTTLSGGVLFIDADSRLGTAPGVATPGNIVFTGGTLETTSSFTLNANRGISLPSNTGTLSVDPATTLTYDGVIAGSGTLNVAGSGTLLLSGSNTFTGTFSINNATLRIGASSGVIADTATINLNSSAGSIFDLNNNSEAIGNLTGGGNGSPITLGSGTLTVNQTTDSTFAGIISGSGGLTKAGSAILTLSGVNTYTGATTINAGTLRLGAAGVIADNSAVTLANVAAAIFNLNNFNETVGTLSGGGITGGNISLGSGTLTVNQAADLTYAGVISGTGGLTKAGSNMLTLSGANTYSGTTTINAGTLQLGAAGVIADNSAVTLANVASAIFNLNNFNETVGTLSGGGSTGGNISLGSGTLTVNQAANLTYAGVINGTGGLTKAGSNTLTLSGINTYSGTTTINAGTLQLGAAGVIADNSAVTLANVASAIFNLNNFNETVGTLSGGGVGGNISLGSGTLTVNQGADLTYAGFISGTGGFTKAGSNMLTLSGANTYSGTTTINAGTLQLGVAGVIADNSAVTLANVASAIFSLNNFNETVGTLSGGGITGGNINLGSGTLTVNQAADLTYAGVMSSSGGGGLTKAGSSTLTLSGANTYNGTTTINAGTLQLGAAGVIADNSAVTLANVASAIFDLNNFNETVGTLSGGGVTGGNINLGSGTLTVNQASALTYAGIISGSGNLVKNGASVLTLSGTSTYTGSTTINAGGLTIASDAALGTAPISPTVNSLILNGGTLSSPAGMSSITLNANRGITLTATSTITVASVSGSIISYGGIITGSGGLTKAGTGSLVLSGANTYTGTTTVNTGTLRLGASNVIPDASAVTMGNVGVTALLDLNGNSDTVGSLSGGSATAGNISLGSGTLTVNQTANLTYAAAISGSGNLVKTGSATLTLSGTNTYSGTTTISGGTLKINADSGLGTAPGSPTAGSIVIGGGTLETANTFTLNANRGITLSSGGGILLIDPTKTLTYSGIITGSTALTKQGTGTLILGGANSYTGGTTISAGTLQLGAPNVLADAGAVTLADVAGAVFDLNGNNETIANLTGGGTTGGNITLGAGTLTATQSSDGVYAGIISGSGGFTKAGSAILTLSNANTYSGVTNISAGAIYATNNNSLGDTAGNTVIANNAALNVGGGVTIAEALNVTGTGISSAGAVRNISGDNTLSGAITLAGSSRINSDANTLTLTGGIVGTGQGLTVGGSGNTTISTTGINTSTAGTLTKDGSGVLLLNAANNYTGATTINAGKLQLGASNRIADSSDVVLADVLNTVFDLNSFSEIIANLTGGGTTGGNITLGAGTLTATQSSDGTYAGIISGSGGFTKAGSAVLTLSNANTYSGVTNISAGAIYATNNNSLGDTVGNTVIANNAALNVGAGVTIAEALNVTGTGISSAGAVRNISGGNTLSGAITLAGGSRINSDANTLTLTGGIVGTGQGLTVGGSGNTTISTTGINTSTAGTLTKDGSGVLLLNAANNYTGATTINAGKLQLGASDRIADSSDVVFADVLGAVFDLNGNNETIANLTGGGTTGGNITLGAGTLTATQGSDGTYAGIISGSGGFTKAGSAVLTLSNANTYSGVTNISAGAIYATNNNSLGDTAGNTVIANNAALNVGAGVTIAEALNVTGTGISSAGAVRNISGDNTLSGAITLAGGSRINSDANTLTLTGGIVGTGQGLTVGGSGNTTISTTGINTSTAGTLTKDGSGVLLLNATNNYTGATTINAGKLQLGASDRIADSSDVVLADVLNTVFDLNSFSEIIANLTGGGTTGGNITLGAGTLTVTQSSNGTYAGVMSGSGGFTKAGSNILTLSGINTYTGATTINAGTLRLGIANAIASNSAVSLADVASAVFDLNNFSQTIGTLSGGGSTGGNINLGNGAFTVTQAINGTYAGVMSGSGAFTKAGSGILTLSGANTYTGLTSINAGAIEITNNASLGTSAGATTIASGAALQINTSGLTISDAMSIAGTGLSGNGVIRNMSGTNIFSGTMTLSSASTINVDAGSLTFSNNITGTGNTITFNGAGNTTLSSALNTGASAGLVKNGTGTLTLSAANTYTGATNINSGKISVLNAGALGTSSSTTIASNAALDIGVSSLTNTNTINLNGTGISNAGALVLSANNTTINNQLVLQSDSTIGSTNSGTMTFGGAITGANTALTINLANADVVLPAVTLNSDLTIQSNSTSIGNGITLAIAGAFTVSNNTSFTNNGTINAGSFTLSGANNILLGTSTLNTTGAVNITGGNATGRTNALSLFINLNTANLIGTIDGATGEAAALKVAFVGSTLNTLFFNGFDLVLLHTPPAPPAPTPTPDVFVPVVPITAFDTLPGLIASYNNVNNTPTTQTVPLNSVASYTNTASGLINLDIPTGSSSFFDTTILGSSPFLGVSLQGANTGEISDFLGLQ